MTLPSTRLPQRRGFQSRCKITLQSCSKADRLAATLVDRLVKRPVTVLTGARQTGKTTLVRDLLPDAGGPPAIYFSLDDPDERLRLGADPVRRLDHGKRLVILDEVQKHPGLLDAVKLLADRGEGRRFLRRP